MIGAETGQATIPFVESERMPNAKERQLWERAMNIARVVVHRSYLLKYQWTQIKTINDFATKAGIPLDEPQIASLADRMFSSLKEVETLKDLMCQVNQNKLGIRMNANGQDLDIVQPKEGEPVLEGAQLGWVIPVIVIAVIVAAIIARWLYLEDEVGELNDQFDGVIERSDEALCKDPKSQQCKNWIAAKKSGSYYRRQTMIDDLKNAAGAVGTWTKNKLGWGLIIAVPLLLWSFTRKG